MTPTSGGMSCVATAISEGVAVSTFTSPVFPDRPCAPGDPACAAVPEGPSPELDAQDLELLTRYLDSL